MQNFNFSHKLWVQSILLHHLKFFCSLPCSNFVPSSSSFDSSSSTLFFDFYPFTMWLTQNSHIYCQADFSHFGVKHSVCSNQRILCISHKNSSLFRTTSTNLPHSRCNDVLSFTLNQLFAKKLKHYFPFPKILKWALTSGLHYQIFIRYHSNINCISPWSVSKKGENLLL